MTHSNREPQKDLPPGQRLFNSFVRHISWNTEGVPEPSAFHLDSCNSQLSVRFSTPGQGKGVLAAQGFEGGLLASTLHAGLLLPIERHNVRDDGFAPAVSLQMMMGGKVEWTDRQGREYRSSRHHELWTFQGMTEWRRSAMLPSDISQSHVTVATELLQRWLQDCPRGESSQRIIRSLRAARGHGGFEAHTLPPSMMWLAQRLQTLLEQAHEPTFTQRMQIEGLAMALLGIWLDMPEQPDISRQARWQRAVGDALDIIQHEYAQDLSISSLSRRVGINECYLKRAFREQTGMGIAAYIRRLRLQTALAMLEENRLPIHAVARHVGYTNPSHFARVFQDMHGFLPSEVQPGAAEEES